MGIWARRIGAAAAIAVAVLIVTPMIGSSSAPVGPGLVTIGFHPTLHGRTTFAVPPIGRASAPTHRGPVEVRLELRSLDVTRLVDENGRIETASLRSSIDADLRSAIGVVVARFVVIGGLVGLVAGALLPRRRLRAVLAGGVEGLVVSAMLVGSALPGFDVARFQDLTFEGPVTAGGQIVQTLSATGGPVGRRVDVLAEKLAGLCSATVTDEIGDDDGEVVILHISDLHLNPIGARLARRLATAFDVDAVLDTGDTTSFGSTFEGAYAELLADFPVPYLFVAGNHDSRPNRQAIKATSGVVALDDTSFVVGTGDAAVRIAGFDDPLITTTEDVPRDRREAVELAATPRLNALLEREHPDVLAVHNPVILQRVLGKVPLAVAGHQHETKLGARDGTLISLVGSTGATGLGSLLVDADLPASASLLRFRGGVLVAIDELEAVGTSGDLTVRRHTITDADRTADDADFIGHDADEGRAPASAETTSTSSTTSTSTTTSTSPSTTGG